MVDLKRFSNAVWSDDLAAVDAMIADGVDVNAADGPRDPPIHLAIEQQWIEITRHFFEAGADINRDKGDGWTPLVHAIDVESDAAWQAHHEIGHESTALNSMLLAAGATVTEPAIQIAGDYNNRKALELLRRYATDLPSTGNENGLDPQ